MFLATLALVDWLELPFYAFCHVLQSLYKEATSLVKLFRAHSLEMALHQHLVKKFVNFYMMSLKGEF